MKNPPIQQLEMHIIVEVVDADAAWEAALYHYEQMGRGEMEANAHMPNQQPLDLPHALLEATLAWMADTDLRLLETAATLGTTEAAPTVQEPGIAALRLAREALWHLAEAEGDLGWNQSFWQEGGEGAAALAAITAALANTEGLARREQERSGA